MISPINGGRYSSRRDVLDEELEVAQSAGLCQSLNDLADQWWAVLGSNQWPLPCETGVRGLRINDMRGGFPIATGTWYHVMSFDITQCHELSVPKLSQLTTPSVLAPCNLLHSLLQHPLRNATALQGLR